MSSLDFVHPLVSQRRDGSHGGSQVRLLLRRLQPIVGEEDGLGHAVPILLPGPLYPEAPLALNLQVEAPASTLPS